MINKGTILADTTTGVDPESGEPTRLTPLIIDPGGTTDMVANVFTNLGVVKAMGSAGLTLQAGTFINSRHKVDVLNN